MGAGAVSAGGRVGRPGQSLTSPSIGRASAFPLSADHIRFLAVASPGYVAQHGRPDVPDDLHRHRCIRQRLPGRRPYRWEFMHGGAEIVVDPGGALTLDHYGLMVEAARAGLGIAFVPEWTAREALACGQLEALLLDWSPAFAGLRLYYPRLRHTPATLRAFADVLREVTLEEGRRDAPGPPRAAALGTRS